MAPSMKNQPDRPIWPSVTTREAERATREKADGKGQANPSPKPATTATQAEGFGSFVG